VSAASAQAGGLGLEVVAGKAAGEKLAVEDRIMFGRQTEGPGRLAGDPELSRRHAEVMRASSGQFTIEDLASTNGTFVNGVRVAGPTVLTPGDLIDLGATRLIVRDAPVLAHPRPAVHAHAATMTIDVPPASPGAQPAGPPPIPAIGRSIQVAAPDVQQESAFALADAARLELALIVDFERCEATVAFGGGTEPLHLRVEDGRWRISDAGTS